MTEERRVVVTGMGAVSSVGNTVEESWNSLIAGRSGIGRLTHFDPTGLRCQIGGEVKGLDLNRFLDPKTIKRQDPFCHFAMVASQEALMQAGIADGDTDGGDAAERIGVMIGSGVGGLNTLQNQCGILNKMGADKLSSLLVPMMIINMASGAVALAHHFRGPGFGIASACASGLHAIGESAWMIRRGDADVMVTGGSEASLNLICLGAFGQMRALSENNNAPEQASRPFDLHRDGFVPAEGAGILVLEELEHAKRRGAVILAEVAGYGSSCDAYHITAPREDGRAAVHAVQQAMQHAGVTGQQIQYVNAHGTSTHLNDKIETQVLKTALGEENARHCAVSSTKSMTGHMLGAAGGFESVVCVKALQTGVIPPTVNQFERDPDCDLDYVPNQAREMKVDYALKENFGFGGHNAAVIYRRFE